VRLRAARDQALILMDFWRAFRADELCRLRVEQITVRSGRQLEVFLASSKTDREHRGQVVVLPALKRLCPVQAYKDWLAISELQKGPVFRPINQWGCSAPKVSSRMALPMCWEAPLRVAG